MKQISVQLDAHLAGAVTSLATCWKITRTDGVILGFTDHDKDLTVDDLLYVASSGYFRSAIANSTGNDVGNMEVKGFLDDDLIAEQDLINGAYDYAEVEIFLVNWADLTQGILRLRYGFFGEVNRFPSGLFSVELRGLVQLFSATVGRVVMPECDADLGDTRCKFVLIPAPRQNNTEYRVGDRVIVPQSGTGIGSSAGLLNPDFEYAEANSVFGWSSTGSGYKVSNIPPDVSFEGFAWMQPRTGPVGTAFQRVRELGDATEINTFSYRAFQKATGWQHRAVIEILDIIGNVANTSSTSWATTTLNTWVLRTLTTDPGEEDITLNGFRVRLEWRPNPITYPDPMAQPAGPAPILFDDASITHNGTGDSPKLVSAGFELTYADATSIQNWTGGFGPARVSANVNLQPQHGEAYMRVSGFSANYQTIRLDTITGFSTANIDAGLYLLKLSGYVGSEEWGYDRRVVMRFYDTPTPNPVLTDDMISEVELPWSEVRPERYWLAFTLRGEIPPLARSVVIYLDGRPGERQTSTAQKVCYDNLSLLIFNGEYEETPFGTYGGLEFECTVAGFSATTQPVFDTDLGDLTVDGTVTWEAVSPTFTVLATVDTVTDNTTFTVTGVDAETGWFDFGIAEFLDGLNAKRRMEIKTWDNVTKTVVLMLPIPYAPEIGDTLKMVVGCDMSRTTCQSKFGNIINFQGFPDVPGTDQYFKVGGT